jgi:alpha-tubulin suppressor-like RCC1 family protein
MYFNGVYSQCYETISKKGYHTLALREDGSLWAWGMGENGQLGDGASTTRTSPVPIGNSTDWESISAGVSHSAAIKGDGTLWRWGSNYYGGLGNGTTNDGHSPAQMGNSVWQTVSAGMYYTTAIRQDGTLWAWGYNEEGQLGDGTTANKLIPVQVGNSNDWVYVYSGYIHTLAIKSDGSLWAWGHNGYGKLGIGSDAGIVVTSPVQIAIGQSWSKVAMGQHFTVALRTDGTLWSCGSFTGMGTGTMEDSNILTQIGNDNDWLNFSTGDVQVLAIKTDGSLWAWGSNYNGEYGDGTTAESYVPVPIGTDSWNIAETGASSSAGIKADGTLWGWAWSTGNGTPDVYYSPVPVACQPLSVDSNSMHQLVLYPNPTLSQLHFQFGNNAVADSFSVYDMFGRKVMTKLNPDSSIEVGSLSDGMYVVEVVSGQNKYTSKFFKTH